MPGLSKKTIANFKPKISTKKSKTPTKNLQTTQKLSKNDPQISRHLTKTQQVLKL
jgi:hypothetical protein